MKSSAAAAAAAAVESSSPQKTQHYNAAKQTTLAVSLALAMAASTLTPVQPANAYIPSDYATETVQTAIQDLKAARGNSDDTFKIYESIAGIITEGKGVGGQINYSKYTVIYIYKSCCCLQCCTVLMY